jgi:hypothetical protein
MLEVWLPTRKRTRDRLFRLRYNGLVPDVKPFRLTESVKAAG